MTDKLVDRRTVLRWGGVAALALAGCSSPKRGGTGAASTTTRSGPATTRPRPRPRTTTTTTNPNAGPPPWSQLASKLTGRFVLPSAAGFAVDARLFDPRFDRMLPAAIAYCATPVDVQHCVDFARSHEVAFAARAGGHSYAGYSTTPGLMIDVTPMSGISVGPSGATIGAGARLIDVYSALNARGVSLPGGSCPSVGIAGLALGGGIGVVARKHGLTCDAVTGLQVVTADGRLVTADAETNSDLFWACRGGGGGNFGVVTQFQFATFATSDVALFTLRWPWGAVSQVLPAWLRWIGNTPDEIWSNCILDATAHVQVNGIYLGDQGSASSLLGQLVRDAGNPSSNFIETTPLAHAMYVEAGCAQLDESACRVVGQSPNAQLPRGPSFAGSAFVDEPLDNAGVAAVVAGLDERIAANLPGAIAFDAYGGVINRVAAESTAFVHRTSLACAQFSVSYSMSDSPSRIAGHQAWLARYRRELAAHLSSSAYQNYIDPTQPDWPAAYYGANLPRLRKVKRQWDPDEAFRFAQSIPPA